MILSQIINIFNATEDLANKDFTNEQQWRIYKFRKALKEHVNFYTEREKLINDKYMPFADEEGVLRGEHYKDYMKEKEDLGNTEVEFEFDKMTLPLVGHIDFKTIEALEDFIEFEV